MLSRLQHHLGYDPGALPLRFYLSPPKINHKSVEILASTVETGGNHRNKNAKFVHCTEKFTPLRAIRDFASTCTLLFSVVK